MHDCHLKVRREKPIFAAYVFLIHIYSLSTIHNPNSISSSYCLCLVLHKYSRQVSGRRRNKLFETEYHVCHGDIYANTYICTVCFFILDINSHESKKQSLHTFLSSSTMHVCMYLVCRVLCLLFLFYLTNSKYNKSIQ